MKSYDFIVSFKKQNKKNTFVEFKLLLLILLLLV